ncbi:amino acid permease [Rhodococcoides fascians]|uniref:APC family permease n=1 Tax=Rhodococcoides fascians TaxID=1828 RepID=UPI000B9B6292|nr:APC family permease [Rhodococcus fascians]OZE92738.1 amino acid permease [Rhodococcus fascians]OZF23371.1 amino acid permease [Rhodococcus fascians]OZF25085.1 amino acid permease [Rhodococcus fascians]OZF73019.1 amino acid permease [Rhodococcus fascians]OZF74184.1 amino acid permease [Rhodococcus fascians]
MASDHSPSVHPNGSESDGSSTPLRRAISGKLLFVFILGDVLGAGIYALVGEIAGEVGGAIWLPMLLALLMALLTAASYAELVTKYPRAGGAAVFAQRAFRRPIVSFLVGFSMLAAGVTSAGGLALAFSGDYLAVFLDVPAVPAAVVFLLLVGLLNARGITESLRANLGMTVIEVSGLVVIIALAGLVLSRGDGAPSRVLEFTDDTTPTMAVLGAALLAFYSFVGFETSANIAEEVEDVRRVHPRALLGAVTTAGVVYVLVGLAVATVVPADTLAQSTGPLLEVVDAADAGIPPWVFSLVALVAVANGALLTMIMASRLTFGMARDGLLPVALAKVLPGRKTPWAAIVATTVVAMVLCTTGSVAALAETVVLLLLFVFISTNIAVLVLRRDRSDTDHFRTPTALPVLALITCAVLLTQQSAATWLRAGLLLAVGIALYYVGRVVSNKTATEPRSITR